MFLGLRSRVLPTRVVMFAVLAVVTGCATPGPGTRDILTKEELHTLKPEIAEHLRCVAGKIGPTAWASIDAQLLVDGASQECRDKLGPFAAGLKRFNLPPDAQKRYLRAVEASSREVVLDRVTNQRTRSVRRPAPAKSL